MQKIISPAPDSVFLINAVEKRIQDCTPQELEILSRTHPYYFEETDTEDEPQTKKKSRGLKKV